MPRSRRARRTRGAPRFQSDVRTFAAQPCGKPFAVEHEREADQRERDPEREERRGRLRGEPQAEDKRDDRVHQRIAHHPLGRLDRHEVGVGAESKGPDHPEVQDADQGDHRRRLQNGARCRADHCAREEAHDAHEQHLDPAVHRVVPADGKPVPQARRQSPAQDPRQADQHRRVQARRQRMPVVQQDGDPGEPDDDPEDARRGERLAEEKRVEQRHEDRSGRCKQRGDVAVDVELGDRDSPIAGKEQERPQDDRREDVAHGRELLQPAPGGGDPQQEPAADQPADRQDPHRGNGENRLADEEIGGPPDEVDRGVACDDQAGLALHGRISEIISTIFPAPIDIPLPSPYLGGHDGQRAEAHVHRFLQGKRARGDLRASP